MKYIVVYDNTGKIFAQYKGDSTVLPDGIPYLILDDYDGTYNEETYRPILSIDVTKTPHEPVFGKTRQEITMEKFSLDEYKAYYQEKNKKELATFLKENPLLWTDGLYYGVTQEDQDEMNLDFSIYQLKQRLGDTEWKLQWHSVKSVCKDFTSEEFSALLNEIIEFVYPYRQLEMQYKEAIYSATTKDEVDTINIVYSLEYFETLKEDTTNE